MTAKSGNFATASDESTSALLAAIDGIKAVASSALPEARAILTSSVSEMLLGLAVRGWTSPAELLPQRLEQAEKSRILDIIDSECEKSFDVTGGRWLLRDRARRAELIRRSRAEILAAVAKAPPADMTARAIRYNYLGSPALAGLPMPELRALAEMEPAVADLAPHPVDPGELRRALALRTRLDEYDNWIGPAFVGRSEELAELVAFCDDDHGTVGDVRVCAVWGTGGVGKSTLVAAAARLMLTHEGGALVVHLDLDRGDLSPDDPTGLSIETLRQIGVQQPTRDGELKGLRDELREVVLDRLQSDSNLEALPRDARSLLAGCLEWTRNDRISLAVIVDTFEHAENAGAHGLDAMLRWAGDLVRVAGAFDLRLVLCGRSQPPLDTIRERLSLAAPVVELELADLTEPDGIALLVGLGVDDDLARLIHATMGGNPLVLRLAADFVGRERGADELQAIARDVGAGVVPKSVVQGVLYDRFLKHIVDADARKFAHPGLLLPELTVDLIRKVLAPLEGRRGMSVRDGRRIFDSLASSSWLVRRDGDRLVQHAGARRLMLMMIVADSDRALETARVRRAALVHHLRRSSEGDRAAAAYHLLMEVRSKEDLEVVATLDLEGTGNFLRKHLDDLPDIARTFVRMAELEPRGASRSRPTLSSRAMPVDQASRELTDELWQSFMIGRSGEGGEGDRLVEQVDPRVALDHWRARPFGLQGSPPTFVLCALAETGAWYDQAFDADLVERQLRSTVASGPLGDADLRRIYWFARLALLRSPSGLNRRQMGGLRLLLSRALATVPVRSGRELSALAAVVEGLNRGQVEVVPNRLWNGRSYLASLTRMHLQRSVWRDAVIQWTPTLRDVVTFQSDFADRVGSDAGLSVIRIGKQALFFAAADGSTKKVFGAVQARINDYEGRSISQFARIDKSFERVVTTRVGSTAEGSRSAEIMVLRGLTPELHRPAREALVEAFETDPRLLYRFAVEVRPLFSVKPRELEPDVFVAECLSEARSFALALVQAADRARVLSSLLSRAIGVFGHTGRLDSVQAALKAWDFALTGRESVDWWDFEMPPETTAGKAN